MFTENLSNTKKINFKMFTENLSGTQHKDKMDNEVNILPALTQHLGKETAGNINRKGRVRAQD